jgi:uncharacterized protein (DUF58 family)
LPDLSLKLKSVMWFNNFFTRKQQASTLPLFDEAFLRRLERLSFRTAPSLRGVTSGERRSRDLQPALDFSDHRPYTHGDDLRHIDWKAFARQEELFVKLGETTQSVSVHILLDCSPSMAWDISATTADTPLEPGRSSKWTGARRLAGALGYLALAGGERLLITPFAGRLGEGFGPTQGKKRAVSVLQFIARLKPSSQADQESGLVHSLTSYSRSQPGGGILIIISDLLDAATSAEIGQGAQNLMDGLRHLTPPRWQVLVMHLLSEQELNPALQGDYDLRDLETGQALPFRLDDLTIGQYRLRVRRWCNELSQACARRGATYTQVLAEWPFERAVVPYLRQRGVIQ